MDSQKITERTIQKVSVLYYGKYFRALSASKVYLSLLRCRRCVGGMHLSVIWMPVWVNLPANVTRTVALYAGKNVATM